MRKSTICLSAVTVAFAALCGLFIHAYVAREAAVPLIREKAGMVKRYGLTDLCIFTDARYTRHPSMADLHTPFQDHPLALEHFPSASLMTPPPHLKRGLSPASPGQPEGGAR